MATPTYPPHPLLKEPVIYIADPPQHVGWGQLYEMFNRCGPPGRIRLPGPRPKSEKHPIHFQSLFAAEMALATLHGEFVHGVYPPWMILLSHSPTLESPLPTCRRWSQRVILDSLPAHRRPATMSQIAFKWFRPLGPLVSVRANMSIGNLQSDIVIEYWDKAHSDIASSEPNLIHRLGDGYYIPTLKLRFFDPCSLRCSGAVDQIGKEDDYASTRSILIKELAVFGEITRAHFSKPEEGLDDVVTFKSSLAAASALSSMEVSGLGYYHRFEYYNGPDIPPSSSNWFAPESNPTPSDRPPVAPSGSTDNTTRPQGASLQSHPLLIYPILYVANPPKHVVWNHLRAEFAGRGCGRVQDLGKSAVEGTPGSHKWAVRFIDLYHAEMALATMQETLIIKPMPQWTMILSHSPTLASTAPSDSMLSQYLRTDPSFFTSNMTPQLLFKCFRPAGPLVSVRMNVDVGNKERTAVVQYWNERHANSARMRKNGLHKKIQRGTRPPFSLRTFDPCILHCSGFESSFTQRDLMDHFSGFGTITSASLEFKDASMYGVVAFSRPSDAALALQAMNGKPVRGGDLTVRYEEPDAQHIFRRPTRSASSPLSNADYAPGAPTDVPPGSSSEQLRKEAHEQVAERQAKEASEAKVKRRQDKLLRKAQAERRNAKTKQDIEAATAERQAAYEELDLAKQLQEMASRELADTKQACAEAKRIWLEAMDREATAGQKVKSAQEVAEHVLRKKQDAEESIKILQEEEVSSRVEAETLQKELDLDELDEETVRQAELAESIRRMAELRKLEKAGKDEQARKSKQAAEETLKREQEEAERLRREQREREDKARQDAENRQRVYQQAVAKEQARCRLRDMQFCPNSFTVTWHEQRALERFKLVSDEFDSLKFQESQPLTFDCVPWPILVQPRHMTFDAIDWSAVEQFFNAMEKLLQDQAEYKALVEKAHRRFHPDKWRARGILSSVWDDDLRGKLEVAGNVVAQAITPLWVKTRQSS